MNISSNKLLSPTNSVLSCKDLLDLGITYNQIYQLRQKEVLLRSGRGVYTLLDGDITEHHSLALISKQLPNSIISLQSALSFHSVTTQIPNKVWISIDYKVRAPKVDKDMVPHQLIYTSSHYMDIGVEQHLIEGVNVKIYNLPKTVVDCFKFRNKIGLDIALEALKEVYQDRRCTIDEIWHYAQVCRVKNVMRPYLEMLVA